MRMTWMAVLLSLVLVCLAPIGAQAQIPVVFSPTKVQFDSPDHIKDCPSDGCLAGYKIELWLAGVDPATGSPASVFTLAKNKVTTTGSTPTYQALLSDVTPLWSVPQGLTFVLRMVAVGEPPTLISVRSNETEPFATCTFTLSAPAGMIPATGGTTTVTITPNGSTCGWMTTSILPWGTFSPSSGIGTTTVTFTAPMNPGQARTSSLLFDTLPYTLTQAGAPMAPRPVTNIIIK
jgi:hypothetical protein